MGSSEDVSKYIYTGDADPVEWFKLFEVRCAFAEWNDNKMLNILPSFLKLVMVIIEYRRN